MLVEHAVFSMHLVSFILLSTLALKPLLWLAAPALTMDSSAALPTATPSLANAAVLLTVLFLVVLWQFGYVTAAIRRFYLDRVRNPYGRTLLALAAAALIYLANSVFITAVQTLGAAFALASL